jgi:hypothetical protein
MQSQFPKIHILTLTTDYFKICNISSQTHFTLGKNCESSLVVHGFNTNLKTTCQPDFKLKSAIMKTIEEYKIPQAIKMQNHVISGCSKEIVIDNIQTIRFAFCAFQSNRVIEDIILLFPNIKMMSFFECQFIDPVKNITDIYLDVEFAFFPNLFPLDKIKKNSMPTE